MKWKVLLSAPYAMPVIDRYKRELAAAGCEIVVAAVRERLNESDLLPIIESIDGVICGDDRFTRAVFERAKNLKVISKWGTGIDSIDREAAREHGVIIRNTPNAFSEPVADTVFAAMLHFSRNLGLMNEEMHQGRWFKPQSETLGEKILGVIGVGNCGKAVIRRARAFGMRILGNDIAMVDPDFIREFGVELTSIEHLLTEADFVTLHTDLNPTSFQLINEERLAAMRAGAYIINTSRGPVIKEEALIKALQRGAIAGAALDVFEVEPLPENSPLRKMKNVLLSPHNANSSPRAAERVHQNTIMALIEELEASEKRTAVNG